MKYIGALIAFFTIYHSAAQPSWQQRVNTRIDVRLDDRQHKLFAYEEFDYTNNSPDTLKFIYVHLWPNAYKNDRTPFEHQLDINHNTSFYYAKPQNRGYIDSLMFTVDGHAVDYLSTDATPDIARIDLPKPLLPGQTIKVTTPFKVKIPRVFSRMGHTGQAYYISQWFPKPAVYDRYGWHPISYLDQGEFYSEYGSYDVSITLPANYVVMATGNCTDEKENEWLDELAKKPLPTQRYKLIWQQRDSFPASALETKTLHFHEDNVHDFAWFADKRFLVRKDTVHSPGTGQVVTCYAAFMPSYWSQWEKATDYLKETVRHYGKWIGPYQYKTIKAVLGDLRAGGGMEYPTVTIIDKTASAKLEMVIVHEAGHNWFYGMLGSNERDHAWMDEGINTFYEQKTSREIVHDSGNRKKSGLNETLVYFERAATHDDQAIDQTSENFEKLNYGLDIYFKTAMSLRWLEAYMGEQDFEAGMHDYYNTWHFHHPYPDDFRACMKRHTSMDVDWFFDTLLHSDKKIDYTITKARTESTATNVTVRNNTGVIAPVLVSAYHDDSLVSSAWSQPFAGRTTVSVPATNWNKLEIDNLIPDAKSTNDVYRRHALFHHFGLKVKPFVGLNTSDKDKLFISPAVGYNQYDGLMAGLVLHNITLPENRFRFVVTPLYSFHPGSVVGCGSVGYVWYPGNIIKEILLQADGKTFHYNEMTQPADNKHLFSGYTKVAPSLNITFNEHNATSPVIRMLTLKTYFITESYFDTSMTFSSGLAFVKPVTAYSAPGTSSNSLFNYELLRYTHRNDRTYNPFSYVLEGQLGADFSKIMAEGSIRIDYNKPKKALYVRAFLGKFFAITNTSAAIERYELNASYSGVNDYLYDGTYLARNASNGIPSQQISMQEGGFKVPVYSSAARSDNWMGTINLSTDLPKIPFVRLFFDAGLIPNATPSFTNSSSTTLLYDGGIEVHLIKDVASIYIPIIMSSDFRDYINNTWGKKNAFGNSLSFTLQFQNINWLKAPKRALKMVVN